jgi:hypothetical protein
MHLCFEGAALNPSEGFGLQDKSLTLSPWLKLKRNHCQHSQQGIEPKKLMSDARRNTAGLEAADEPEMVPDAHPGLASLVQNDLISCSPTGF